MKRILFVSIILLAGSVVAQSPTALRLLDNQASLLRVTPIDPNGWSVAGAELSYPLYGDKSAFDLSFKMSTRFAIAFTEFDFGRTWYLLTFGNIGLPNFNHVSVFDGVVSDDEGLNFGMQLYSVFGKIYKKALTTSFIASTKINSFGDNQVLSYRFGASAEVSFSDGGLPLIINGTVSYLLLDDKGEFASLQSEPVGKGVWTANPYAILPIGGNLGMLVQSTFAENAKPLYRVGVIMATGL